MNIDFDDEATDTLTEVLSGLNGYNMCVQWFDPGRGSDSIDVVFQDYDFGGRGDTLQLYFQPIDSDGYPDSEAAQLVLPVDQIEHLHIY